MSIHLIYSIIILLLGQGPSDVPSAYIQSRPNVLMIVVDDMNGYGIKEEYPLVKIPYLDSFRKQSINFVNAVCNSPVCNKSRSSFFSGVYPHRTGAYLNGSDGWNRSELLHQIKSIPECFKENGYSTWGRGKIFHNKLDSTRENAMWDNRPIYKGGFGPFPEKEYWYAGNRFRSIKAWDGPDEDFPDVKNANAAIEFLETAHDKPFFMYYGLWRPHSPYTAPKRFFDLYQEDEITIPKGRKIDDLRDVPFLGKMLVDSLKRLKNDSIAKEELYKKFLLGYCANTSFTDWNVGRVMEALDQSPYAENTIVIVFSDNGFHCGEKERWGKATLWEQADYVPLLVRTPKTNGRTSTATVSLVDVYPTLVDYCQLEAPDHQLDGQSIRPVIEDPNATWSRPSITSYGINYASVRDERFRYICYPDGKEELYDHSTDPFEFENIISQKETALAADKLKAYIPKKWAKSLGGRLEVPRDFNMVMREK